MSGIYMSQVAGIYPTVPANSDPNFANVALLLHFNSTPGFLKDSSPIGATCTSTGTISNGLTTPIATVSPQSGFGDGLLSIANTTSAVLVPGNAAFGWNTGVDFTVECWLYKKINAVRQLAGQWIDAAPIYARWTWFLDAGGKLNFQASTNPTNLTTPGKVSIVSTNAVANNAWSHLAVCRSGNTIRFFINGVLNGSFTTMNFPITFDPAFQLGIGKNNSQNNFAMDTTAGYIDEFRITNGVARYTAAFTPPSSPF